MAYILTERVRKLAKETFSPADLPRALRLLETAELKTRSNPTREMIHLGLLIMAEGHLSRLRSSLKWYDPRDALSAYYNVEWNEETHKANAETPHKSYRFKRRPVALPIPILFASGIILGLLLLTPIALITANPVCVTVRNASTGTISSIAVSVQDQRLNFPDLAPGQTARRWCRNAGKDGHYSLQARREDRTKIIRNDGYLTSGIYYSSAQFTVTSTNVTFEDFP